MWTVDEVEFHRRRPQRSSDHRWNHDDGDGDDDDGHDDDDVDDDDDDDDHDGVRLNI